MVHRYRLEFLDAFGAPIVEMVWSETTIDEPTAAYPDGIDMVTALLGDKHEGVWPLKSNRDARTPYQVKVTRVA